MGRNFKSCRFIKKVWTKTGTVRARLRRGASLADAIDGVLKKRKGVPKKFTFREKNLNQVILSNIMVKNGQMFKGELKEVGQRIRHQNYHHHHQDFVIIARKEINGRKSLYKMEKKF